jgi:hypothetical protein
MTQQQIEEAKARAIATYKRKNPPVRKGPMFDAFHEAAIDTFADGFDAAVKVLSGTVR